jgi:hypothetical protein
MFYFDISPHLAIALQLRGRLFLLVWVSFFKSLVDRGALAVRNRAFLSSRLYYYKLRSCPIELDNLDLTLPEEIHPQSSELNI